MKGIYCFLGTLLRHGAVRVGSLGMLSLNKGYYAYVGSGMNGLERRLERHVRSKKKFRWHMDYLSSRPSFVPMTGFCAQTDRREAEHELAAGLEGEGVRGFGCSDCECESHLFYMGRDLGSARRKVERAFSSVDLRCGFIEWARHAVFDLDDTLVDYGAARRAALTEISSRVGLEERRFVREYLNARNRVYEAFPHDPRKYSKKLVFGALMKKLGLEIKPQELEEHYWRAVLGEITAFEDSKPALEWLRQQGFSTFVFSSGERRRQRAKLERAGLADLVEGDVYSGEIGIEKGDARAYELALSQLGINKEDAVVIGDSPLLDVETAEEAGVRGILLVRDDRAVEKPLGTPLIRSLRELKGMLRPRP